MSATARMSIRSEILKWCFALYAMLSLVSMAAMSIGAAIVILVILFTSKSAASFRSELQSCFRDSAVRIYFILSCFLTLACGLSLFWGKISPLLYGGRGPQIHFLQDMAKAWYLFWPCLLLIGLKRLDANARLTVFRSWVFTFIVLSAVGILQYFTGWPRPQPIPGNPSHFHATLFLGHHLSVASICIFPFFAILDASFTKQIRFSKKILFIGTLLGCTTLILTYSRTLWLALPIGILIWMVRMGSPLSKNFRIAGLILFIVGTAGISQLPPVQKRIHDGMGISERQALWLANLEFFKERPLTGVGWRYNQELSGYYLMEKYHANDVFAGHAHNNLLDMMGGTGILGTLAWLAWCFWVIRVLFKTQPHSPQPVFARGLVCAWVVFHINGLTQVNFWEAKVQHQVAWVVAWSLLWVSRSTVAKT